MTSTSPHISQCSGPNSVYVVPSAGKYIASGYAADIYQVDEHFVIKRPKFFPDYESENQYYRALIDNEREIYERLGSHEGIIEYYGISDESTGAIKLGYANDGDLADYITKYPKPPKARLAEMIRLLPAAWLHIYFYKVSIQDIKTENVLVQRGVPKVCDFTQGILFPPDVDMREACPKDMLRVDFVGIGCVIYSIAAWEVFDYDYFKEQRWPGPEDLRSVHNVLLGEVITKCWYGSYCSMKAFHDDVVRLLRLEH